MMQLGWPPNESEHLGRSSPCKVSPYLDLRINEEGTNKTKMKKKLFDRHYLLGSNLYAWERKTAYKIYNSGIGLISYSVRWSVTETSCDQRMEKYIDSSISVQGYSIANSCFTILILITRYSLRNFQVLILLTENKYVSNPVEDEVTANQEETGWKNIHGDVFRFSKHKSLFAAALGSGTQLFNY
ncbi:Nonaspanin (TM9SF) [Cynara cardunculus var. scolymus]|uniref:Transmembrane 9 superfamily member n=1 Tax=Cynara cardunculus var. scolymus TaxID=59895 RepID=A0A118K6U3_CYNCS|nr:Nonaspanin (TM9SF) [Cynara cardunculus var. scolymus]